jgi:hypothetical protein
MDVFNHDDARLGERREGPLAGGSRHPAIPKHVPLRAEMLLKSDQQCARSSVG